MFLAGIWGRFSNPDFCCSNKMSIGNLLDREKKTVPKSWLGKKGLDSGIKLPHPFKSVPICCKI